jgi:hypothetical protein
MSPDVLVGTAMQRSQISLLSILPRDSDHATMLQFARSVAEVSPIRPKMPQIREEDLL